MSSVAGTAHKDPVFNVQGLKTKARGRDISGRSWITFRDGRRAKTGGERGQPSLRAMSRAVGSEDGRAGLKCSTFFKPTSVGKTELRRKEIRTPGTNSVKCWDGERRRDRH